MESDFPEKAWMEKENNIAKRGLPTDVESLGTKDETLTNSLQPSQSLGQAQQDPQWIGPPPSIPSANEDAIYPEGGLKAWLVVLGSFCGMVAAFGFMNSSRSLHIIR